MKKASFLLFIASLTLGLPCYPLECPDELITQLQKDAYYFRAPFFEQHRPVFLGAQGLVGPLPNDIESLNLYASDRNYVMAPIISRDSFEPVALTLRYLNENDADTVVVLNIVILTGEKCPLLDSFLHKVIRSWTYPPSALQRNVPTDSSAPFRPIYVPSNSTAMAEMMIAAGLTKSATVSDYFSNNIGADVYRLSLPQP